MTKKGREVSPSCGRWAGSGTIAPTMRNCCDAVCTRAFGSRSRFCSSCPPGVWSVCGHSVSRRCRLDSSAKRSLRLKQGGRACCICRARSLFYCVESTLACFVYESTTMAALELYFEVLLTKKKKRWSKHFCCPWVLEIIMPQPAAVDAHGLGPETLKRHVLSAVLFVREALLCRYPACFPPVATM